MFLEVSVILLTGGGAVNVTLSLPVWYHVPSRGYDVTSCLVCSDVPSMGVFSPGGGGGALVPMGGGGGVWYQSLVLTPSWGHCSGQYASYWNAFLFHSTIVPTNYPKLLVPTLIFFTLFTRSDICAFFYR